MIEVSEVAKRDRWRYKRFGDMTCVKDDCFGAVETERAKGPSVSSRVRYGKSWRMLIEFPHRAIDSGLCYIHEQERLRLLGLLECGRNGEKLGVPGVSMFGLGRFTAQFSDLVKGGD